MSEPTLYQATVEPANIGYDGDERPLVLQEAIDIGALVPVEPDRNAALNVLSTYRRLVLMGAEDTFEATLDALSAALGIGDNDD